MGTQLFRKGHSPQFSAHVCCGRTAWMAQEATCTKVGLGPVDIVRWISAPSPKEGHSTPHFSAHVYCCQTAGWTKMPLGTEVGLSPGDIVLDGDPAPQHKGAQKPPPHFSAHVYCGETVAYLSNCWALVKFCRLPRCSASRGFVSASWSLYNYSMEFLAVRSFSALAELLFNKRMRIGQCRTTP